MGVMEERHDWESYCCVENGRGEGGRLVGGDEERGNCSVFCLNLQYIYFFEKLKLAFLMF